MGAHDHIDQAHLQSSEQILTPSSRHTSCKKTYGNTERLEQLRERPHMLLRQNFSRYHEGALASRLHSSVQRNRCNHGLAGANVPLQQTIHTEGGAHILQNLKLYFLLGICQFKRETSNKLSDRGIIYRVLNAIHPFMIHGPVCLKLQLEEEQLFVHHAPPRLLPFATILRLMNA
ncbi:hypothetical protein D3C72_531480 [compost metagenome]